MTYEAYHLLKLQNHCFPEMENRLGNLQDQGVNPWEKGKITAGAYREDEEDVVYGRNGLWEINPTNTHFWDGFSDDSHFNPPPYDVQYPNSYKKVMSFWDGSQFWFSNQSEVWLEPDWVIHTIHDPITHGRYLRIDYSILLPGQKNCFRYRRR